MAIKTKFDVLVKLKKLEVDKLSRELAKHNSKITSTREKLKKLNEELRGMKYPKNGNFSLIQQFKLEQKALLNEIKMKEEELNFWEHQKTLLTNELREKQIEFEKMKYLQGEEIKKILKKMKRVENREMDEIAVMLFKEKR